MVWRRNGLFRYDGQKVEKIETIADLDGKSVSAIAQDSQGGFLFGHWENSTGKEREDIFASALKLIYQRGEEFQTIFVENEKKDPFSSIGTVIAGRNSEVYFHLTHQNFSDNYKGFARWHPEDGS